MTYWCCGNEFGKHEPGCKNYGAESSSPKPAPNSLAAIRGVGRNGEQPSPVAPSLQEFWNAQSEWSQSTFGTDAERGPIGPLKHLQKEAGEAQEHPEDIFEFADCLFLVFDATRRAGFTLDQLRDACWRKLAINKERHYPKANDLNAAVEHDRSKERR